MITIVRLEAGDNNGDSSNDGNYYPIRIPRHDHIRAARQNQQRHQVKSGLMDEVLGISNFALSWNEPIIYDKLNRILNLDVYMSKLQCSEYEPGIHHHGTMSLLKYQPVTKKSIELFTIFADNKNKCVDQWNRINYSCLEKLKDTVDDIEPNVRLVRIIKNKLYYDWRNNKNNNKHDTRYEIGSQWNMIRLIANIVENVHLNDTVFGMLSFDFPLLPSNFPFPLLNSGSSIYHSDIIYPWSLLVNDEIITYLQTYKNNDNNKKYTDLHEDFKDKRIEYSLSPHNVSNWNSRINKGCHYGNIWFTRYSVARQLLLDLSQLYPEYLDSAWVSDIGSTPHFPLTNSNNTETLSKIQSLYGRNKWHDHLQKTKINQRIPLFYIMKTYKYLIVLNGQSASGRLAQFLRYSGAVILLQDTTEIKYHFSARLKPWVHYVPIAYNGADVIDKIKWLRKHDDLAYALAKNAHAFGQSYLRLEDYYCYTAAFLKEVTKHVTPEALEPSQPKIIG